MAADANDSPDMRVADPEKFNQTTRLRAINEARKEAGEAIQATMTQLRTDVDFDENDRQQILRAAVYRYLTEIEWLAHQAGDVELLDKIKLGTVQIDPPETFQTIVAGEMNEDFRVIGSPALKPWTHDVEGLNGYLKAPEVFQNIWTIHVDNYLEGKQTLSEARATYMPAFISQNAFRMANRFLSKEGIDVELKERDGDAGFDYSDIMGTNNNGEGG